MCDFCGESYDERVVLVRHKRNKHTGVKRFSCNYCEKSFVNKSEWISHERVHTREKPFACGFCKKAFSVKSSLVVHERIHTGEKPFTCKHCHKVFAQSSACRSHERKCLEADLEEGVKTEVNVKEEVFSAEIDDVRKEWTSFVCVKEEEEYDSRIMVDLDTKQEILEDEKPDIFENTSPIKKEFEVDDGNSDSEMLLVPSFAVKAEFKSHENTEYFAEDPPANSEIDKKLNGEREREI